jgi:hypothetical protein
MIRRRRDFYDFDVRGLRQLDHVLCTDPARKSDDKVRGAGPDHQLIACKAVMFVDPVPQRQKVPFEDAVVTRPFPRYPVDAARIAVDEPLERPAT